MKISIIIPTINRTYYLFKTIESIQVQTVKPDELIIIDQSKNDKTQKEILNSFSDEFNIKYILDSKITGLAQARNVGIQNVSKDIDIILFLDDDVILSNNFIEEILKVYTNNEKIYAVGGVITNYKKTIMKTVMRNIFQFGLFNDIRQKIYENWLEYSQYKMIYTDRLGGGLMSYKLNKISEKFDENYIKYSLGEDLDFSLRFSRIYPNSMVIAPKARLIHNKSNVGRYDIRKKYSSYIISCIYLYQKYGSYYKYSRLSLIWYIIGILFQASLLSIKKITIKPLLGCIDGFSVAKNDFKNCDFIRKVNI
ncbi:MAG: glycosyltransferase family 2 protein [Candidatus Helarchaeota archaeon]